jgi:hypothetical protein
MAAIFPSIQASKGVVKFLAAANAGLSVIYTG